ncbi:MAG: hypothetical protein ACRC2H_13465 [Silanimonas sp.]
MALDTVDKIANALANNNSRLVIDKASIANMAAGQLCSLWRATGQPAQGAIPTAAAIPTKVTPGAFGFTNQTLPAESYFGYLSFINQNNGAMGYEWHDRVAHQAGIVLNVTTAQTTNLPVDVLTLGLAADRRGAINYSDLQWFLSVYADGGATASSATINVTYDNGTTGNLNVIAVGGTLRAGREIPLTPFIPVAQQGLFIRGINSVTLSASTTVAGNVGFTCRRQRFMVAAPAANLPNERDWAGLGLAGVPNDACIEIIATCSTTSTGAVRGQGKIIHG